MITIRNADARDAAALAGLLDELGYGVPAEDVPARLQRFSTRGNGQVLVAEAQGLVVAFAAVEITFPIHQPGPVAHLSAFAVAQTARRQGIGHQLLSAVEAAARAAGCKRIVVTSAEPRADAHAFYQAAGWPYSGRRFGKRID